MVLLGAVSLFLALSPLARQRSFRLDRLTLLAAATLLLLIVHPEQLFNPAMQLSYVAVLGLIAVTPALMRLFRHVLGTVALCPAATLGAQLMMAPVLAWHFGVISLAGIFTNLVAIPLVSLLVPFGLLAMLCALCCPPLAVALNMINVPLLRALLFVSTQASRLPWAECPWPLRSFGAVIAYYAFIGLGTLALSRRLDRLAQEWRIPAGREPRMW